MFANNNDNQTSRAHFMNIWLLIVSTSLFPFAHSTASELNNKQYSISHGLAKIDLNEQQRQAIITTHKLTTIPDQLSGKTTAKTRINILKNQQLITVKHQNERNIQNKNNSNLSQDYTADFIIYGATSFLQDDYDGDSFYQTFSVSFDADIYSYNENQLGEVYALLYISKNGGPWTHYFTTDSFLIEGDTDADEYEVITTFLSGYSSDYYDVLIDLYQVDYDNVVASYSSDDNNALYALPLESADYDDPYIEVVEVRGGGIYWLILLLLGVYYLRLKTFN